MLLYNSDALTVNYLEVRYLMHFKFSEKASFYEDLEIKASLLSFCKNMIKRKARLFLLDVSSIKINAEFVNWFNINILPLIKSIEARKIAWLNCDIQVPDKADNLEQKAFNDSAEAMNWLIKESETKKLSFEDKNKPTHNHKH